MTKSSGLNIIKDKNVTVEDLSAQIETLKNDLSALTSSLSEYGVGKAAKAKETAQDRAESLKSAASDKALEAQLHTEEFVKTQPATALGLAAGLGFLVGLVTARR